MPNWKEDLEFHEELRQCSQIAYAPLGYKLTEGNSYTQYSEGDTYK